MDQDRFDRIAKLMAGAGTRRRVLGGLAAALAGALGRQPAGATGCDPACDPKRCEDCKDGYCRVRCDPKQCQACDGYGKCKSTCDPKKCEVCDGYGRCKTRCDPKKCEVCDGYGNCKSTCGPCFRCVDGTCKAPFCGHSVGPNGGCKGACAAAGFTGKECNPVCGSGQFTGYCPVGQGGDNPCCNPCLCDPKYFKRVDGVVTYVGPTAGCPA